MLTMDDYIKNKGINCPSCGSPHIDGGPVKIGDIGEVYQKVSCTECRTEWEDVYVLDRFENIRGAVTTRKTTTTPRIKIRLT